MRWFCYVSLCAALQSLALAAPVLSIQPASPVFELGQPFSLDIVVTGITDLFAFQFDVGFDPAALNARSVTEGPFLASGGVTAFVPGTIDNTAGIVGFTADTLLGAVSGVTGAGVLATVNFNSVHAGRSTVDIMAATLLDSSLFDITFTTEAATVTAIPEPQTISLAVIGLGSLFGVIAYSRRSGAAGCN